MNKKLHIPDSQKTFTFQLIHFLFEMSQQEINSKKLHVSETMIKINLNLCYLISDAPNWV
jgi:hypothetical protein